MQELMPKALIWRFGEGWGWKPLGHTAHRVRSPPTLEEGPATNCNSCGRKMCLFRTFYLNPSRCFPMCVLEGHKHNPGEFWKSRTGLLSAVCVCQRDRAEVGGGKQPTEVTDLLPILGPHHTLRAATCCQASEPP